MEWKKNRCCVVLSVSTRLTVIFYNSVQFSNKRLCYVVKEHNIIIRVMGFAASNRYRNLLQIYSLNTNVH